MKMREVYGSRFSPAKYDIYREGWLVQGPSPCCSHIWKGILAAKDLFMKQVRFRVGKGDNLFLD